jgi:hypothetical protein
MKAYEKGYESVPGSSLPEDQKQVWRGRLQHGRCRVLAKMGKREEAWDAALEVKKMIDDGGEAGKQPAQDGMSPGTPVQESAAVVSTLLDRLHGIAANNTITVPEALPQQSQKAQRLFDIVMGAIARISPFVGGNRDHEHHAAAAACARRRRRPPSLGRVPRAIRQAGARQLRRWHRERRDLIVREDLRNLSRIQLLSHVEELVELLVLRAGGILSYSALREDPQVALDSVRLWVGHLERLYFLYRLRRYAPRLPRALRRDPKFYLWDWSEIADPGVRLENMVAGHLLKWCHFSQDWGPPAPRPEAGAPRGFSRRPRLW